MRKNYSDNFAYHGCGENILEFASIMQNGIFSPIEAKKHGIKTFVENNNSYLDNVVYLAHPHQENGGALQVYILDGGISFLVDDIDKNYSYEFDSYSGFKDEVFVKDSIPKSKIKGIVVNSKIKNKRISELSFLNYIAPEYIFANALSIYTFLQDNGVDGLENILVLINKLGKSDIKSYEDRINQLLAEKMDEYYQMLLSKKDITVMDIVKYYNDLNLPIYDEMDVEEQCRDYKYSFGASRREKLKLDNWDATYIHREKTRIKDAPMKFSAGVALKFALEDLTGEERERVIEALEDLTVEERASNRSTKKCKKIQRRSLIESEEPLDNERHIC